MSFVDIPFLFYFFPLTLILFYVFSFSRKLQNLLLLLMGLVFFGWGDPRNVVYLLVIIIFDTVFGLVINKSRGRVKTFFTLFSVGANVLYLLGVWYLTDLLALFGAFEKWQIAEFTLSIGCAVVLLRSISYLLDVYRGSSSGRNPITVGLYLTFFPQAVLGPVTDFSTFSEQLKERKQSFDRLSVGICRFSVGILKKVTLASAFLAITDNVFAWSTIGIDKLAVPATLAWVGFVSCVLYYYYEFSAYSDIAIGLSYCLGFKFEENMNYPVVSLSMTDYWNRFNISAQKWFYRYIYYPLCAREGTNKDSDIKYLFITWMIIGLWYGHGLNGVIFGVLCFVFILFEDFIGKRDIKVNRAISHLYVVLITGFLWIVIRAENLYQAGRLVMNMFCLNNNGFLSDKAWMLVRENFVYFLLGILFTLPIVPKINKWTYEHQNSWIHGVYTFAYPVLMMAASLLCLSYIIGG